MKFEREDVSLEVEGQDGGNVVGVGAKWTQAQVVFLAALVGMDTQTKLGILRDVVGKLRKGTLVVVRSAWGVRGVLYPVSISPPPLFLFLLPCFLDFSHHYFPPLFHSAPLSSTIFPALPSTSPYACKWQYPLTQANSLSPLQPQILTLSEDLQALGLEVLAEVHPWTKVVNSVVVLRVK